jgi:uncharacterized protein (DUF2141 family)
MKVVGIFALVLMIFPWKNENAILNIEIRNIRNHNGVIRISVYTAENQYPYHPERTYVVSKDSMAEGTVRTTILDLEPGRYGLCFLDDENNSGQMENNKLGIPKEGFGFANNVKPFLKRPDFDQIQFRLGSGTNHMQLITRYKN